jgi:putative membrane protein
MGEVSDKVIQGNSLYIKLIGVVSVLIPLAVAFLLFVPQTALLGTLDVSFLPKLNAIFNTAASLLLVAGFMLIKNRKLLLHKIAMWLAFFVSALFLVSYVIYHTQAPPTSFGGEGFIRYFYYFVLLTHILLAVIIVPFVLITIYNSTTGQLMKHRKIARYTFPLWLYVTVSGVLVYLLISPYYPA